MAHTAATLRLQNSQYFSSGTNFYREDASGENSSISIFLKGEQRFGKNRVARFEAKDEFSNTENWNYLNIYQSYFQFRVRDITAQIGRKIESWSATEDEWKQGIFQPRYTQNKLRPETAGLTGVFVSSSAGPYLWTVGALPVFIPDLGAHFWVDNHKFTSRNPWFDPPASRVRIEDTAHDIYYSINKPPAEKVMAHPGAVAKIERTSDGIGRRFSAAYKPIPQLKLGFPVLGHYMIGSNHDYLNIDITPKVVYHSVLSADIWGKAGGWNLTGGLMHDRPDKDDADSTWIWQNFKPAWIWSALASRELSGTGGPAVKFGILKIAGGYGDDRGEYAGRPSVFEARFQYEEAYMAGLAWPIRGLFKNALETEAKVIYDRIQNGGVVSVSTGYNFTRELRVDGEIDVLGLAGDRAENMDGFFSTYRSNDRFGLGMSYVF